MIVTKVIPQPFQEAPQISCHFLGGKLLINKLFGGVK